MRNKKICIFYLKQSFLRRNGVTTISRLSFGRQFGVMRTGLFSILISSSSSVFPKRSVTVGRNLTLAAAVKLATLGVVQHLLPERLHDVVGIPVAR